jgi:hypothetical protein
MNTTIAAIIAVVLLGLVHAAVTIGGTLSLSLWISTSLPELVFLDTSELHISSSLCTPFGDQKCDIVAAMADVTACGLT